MEVSHNLTYVKNRRRSRDVFCARNSSRSPMAKPAPVFRPQIPPPRPEFTIRNTVDRRWSRCKRPRGPDDYSFNRINTRGRLDESKSGKSSPPQVTTTGVTATASTRSARRPGHGRRWNARVTLVRVDHSVHARFLRNSHRPNTRVSAFRDHIWPRIRVGHARVFYSRACVHVVRDHAGRTVGYRSRSGAKTSRVGGRRRIVQSNLGCGRVPDAESLTVVGNNRLRIPSRSYA